MKSKKNNLYLISTIGLYIFLFTIIYPVFAEVKDNNPSQLFYQKMQNLIRQGEYEEVMLLGERKLKLKNDPTDFIVINTLLSEAAYYHYDFKLAEKYLRVAKNAWHSYDTMKIKHAKHTCMLYLALNAHNRRLFKKANNLFEKLSQSQDSLSELEIVQFNFYYARNLRMIGENNEGIKLLNKIPVEWVIKHVKKEIGKEFVSALYAEKAIANFEFGNYSVSDSSINILKTLASKTGSFSSNPAIHYYHDVMGYIYFAKKQFGLSKESYLKAYNSNSHHEADLKKFNALYYATLAELYTGDYAEYKKLFRRIDMLAFAETDNVNPFRVAIQKLKLAENIQSGYYADIFEKKSKLINTFSCFPEFHLDKCDVLELSYLASINKGDYKKTKLYNDSISTIYKIIEGKKGNNLNLKSLQALSVNYDSQLNLSKSLKDLQNLYSFISPNLHPNSLKRLDYFHLFIDIFTEKNMKDSAFLYSEKAYKLSKANDYDLNRTAYFTALYAKKQYENEKYQKLVTLTDEIIKSEKKLQRSTDFYAFKALEAINELYVILGEYKKANNLISKTSPLDIYNEKTSFKKKLILYNLVSTKYESNENLNKSSKMIEEGILKLEENNPSEKSSMALFLLHLVDLKIKNGELNDAEKNLKKVEENLKKFHPDTNYLHIKYHRLFAKYLQTISDYRASNLNFDKAINLTSKYYGKNHPNLAMILLDKIDLISTKSGKETEIESLFEKVKNIFEASIGKKTANYALLLNKQAKYYITKSKFELAYSAMDEAEKIWDLKLGKESSYQAEICMLRAEGFMAQKRYAVSETQYQKAQNIFSRLYSSNHPNALFAKIGLAKVKYINNDLDAAAKITEEVLDQRLKFTQLNFPVLSFAQKVNFWAAYKPEFEFYNSIAYRQSQKNKNQILKKVYSYTLNTKGLLLSSDASIRTFVFGSKDSTLIRDYKNWINLKESYLSASNLPKAQLDEDKISLTDIQKEIEEIEVSLSDKTNGNIELSSKIIDWNDVYRSLAPKQTAIEMIRFRYFTNTFSDSIIYMSLLLNEKSKEGPKAVLLENGKELETKKFKYYRNATILKQEDYSSYNSYWEPIKSSIPDGNTLFLSLDGVYNQLNPEMLSNPKNKIYAIDQNEFVFVGNTKDIVPKPAKKDDKKSKNTINNKGTFYFLGNPNFYEKRSAKNEIPSLVGAENEIIEIDKIFKAKSYQTVAMLGAQITEDTTKNIVQPSILHIATHGYFTDKKEGTNELTGNPMLNSGLLLSNAGDILADKEQSYVNRSPGILTASEVMDLNFSNTNLVVLSACETGRGKVESGEGVYGLQRAFMVAGAKAVVISLFKVNDEATMLLMKTFYELLLNNGGDFRKALRDSKQTLKNNPQFQNPIFWGAFILSESKPGNFSKMVF